MCFASLYCVCLGAATIHYIQDTISKLPSSYIRSTTVLLDVKHLTCKYYMEVHAGAPLFFSLYSAFPGLRHAIYIFLRDSSREVHYRPAASYNAHALVMHTHEILTGSKRV